MSTEPHLTRYASQGVTLLGAPHRPGGVTLAFTERTGGVSAAPYASLNVGENCGDDEDAVTENRRRLLAALGCERFASRLVKPKQVHGAHVVTITSGSEDAVARAQEEASAGADAVVCTVPDVPVLLGFADCVPVILVAPQAFAVVHSGWPGTEARIVEAAAQALCAATSCKPRELVAYVGPHVRGEDYEVSPELAVRFGELFGEDVVLPGNRLDLGAAVRKTLEGCGVLPASICDECPSTAQATDRFYSYRAEKGACGRHGAIAIMLQDDKERSAA